MRELLLIGGAQGFILSIGLLLIKKPVNQKSNQVFALFIALVSLFLVITSQQQFFGEYPKFFLTSYLLIYLYCPIYYFYLQSLVNPHWKIKRSHLAYFLPALVFQILLFKYYAMSNEELVIGLQEYDYADLMLVDIIAIAFNFYMIFRCEKVLKLNKRELPIESSGVAFRIINLILFLSNMVWAISLSNQFSWSFFGLCIPFSIDITYIMMSLFVIQFSYMVIVKNYYFAKPEIHKPESYKQNNYDKQGLDELSEKICDILKSQRPYLNQEFSLKDLADLCQTDKFKISYTINNVLNTTFTNLINRNRVEAFIELTNDDKLKHYNFVGIAQEAGFKTKSTFYKSFKEIKGCTPKEYFSAYDKQGEIQPAIA
ncbi:helix-turn-helix domain-containing protein [Fulvivirga lutea]|uniref:Helix-turn-helix transcriptional regulator n=1 Tax=Fulvivirga lutea TaxID=2810512 RepID=A0A974WFK4_9BACT|nr:helix-turn-helix domain-containing protein [Fulvivirga lutea]QSE96107.1 helix-turn-helix transcriptional regulator [Fulvivirga lutea]